MISSEIAKLFNIPSLNLIDVVLMKSGSVVVAAISLVIIFFHVESILEVRNSQKIKVLVLLEVLCLAAEDNNLIVECCSGVV